MTTKCREGATIVEIEFANYVKDQIDEVVATGYFGDLNDFMQQAVLYSIARYESHKR
jgi:Arc/MetJ-type ribon-helix-helix transcriptional regulator